MVLMKGIGLIYALVAFSRVQTLYDFYTVSVGKAFFQGSSSDDFSSYIVLEGCY